MIYIDPPYNTGKDFIYKDNYRDNVENYIEQDENGFKTSSNQETSGRYHTNWLNMMYPRLKLARNLLKDDGVIFISIDDNEINNLRIIVDEIFGSDNFLSVITVIVKTEGRRYGHFAKTHEYLLVYSKNSKLVNLNEITVEDKQFKYFDEKGGYNLKDLRNGNSKAFNSINRPNLRYPFYVNLNTKDKNDFCEVYLEPSKYFKEVYPIVSNGNESVWRWGKEKSINEKDNLIARVGKDNQIRIFQKTRKLTQIPKTFWKNKKFVSNKGTMELEILFDNKVFDFPKPMFLLNRILEISIKKDDIILDFFSGSATTAHAILDFNVKNKTNNRFIMVQLPEQTDEDSKAYKAGFSNICEIGKERIRRAGDKIVEETGNSDLDTGFKVFKLDSSNIMKWNPDYNNLKSNLLAQTDNLVDGRSNLDLVYEIMLKYGVDITLPIDEYENGGYKLYSVGAGALIICLDDKITKDVANSIVDLKNELNPFVSRVVLKDSGFISDADKVNVREILKNNEIEEFITI